MNSGRGASGDISFSKLAVAIKRIYEEPSPDDGHRVLVDGQWPRGVSKERARLDAWMREIAPSRALKAWIHEDRSRWDDFRARYLAELEVHRALLEPLAKKARRSRVTLLYAYRDPEQNHAMIVREFVESLMEA